MSLVANQLVRLLKIEEGNVATADAIAILGSPCTDVNELSEGCRTRVETAVLLWKRGWAPWVIPTGYRGEAITMGRYATQLGVPEENLILEPHARTTRENALRVAEVMKSRGLKRVIVVSQDYHVKRGLFWFRKEGIECQGVAAAGATQKTLPVAREYAAWVYTGLRSLVPR